MLCGGNTVIMCGRCDMGGKSIFCRTHFFSYPPPPLGGVTPEKKYPTRYQKFFSSPPPPAPNEGGLPGSTVGHAPEAGVI